jgi:hypothetical protein
MDYSLKKYTVPRGDMLPQAGKKKGGFRKL